MKLLTLISSLTFVGSGIFAQQHKDTEYFKPGAKEIDSFVIYQTLRGIEKDNLFFFLDGKKFPAGSYWLTPTSIKEIMLLHAKAAQKQFGVPTVQGVIFVKTYPNTKFVKLSERLVKEELRREEGVEVYINDQLFTGNDAYLDARATIIPAYSKEGDMSYLRQIYVSTVTTKTSCDCPRNDVAGTKADTSFRFSNGKVIVLCGDRDPADSPATFSEFVLAACGQEEIIDFWDGTQTCTIKMYKDTLFVNELSHLPVGKEFKYQMTVWSTERIYFAGSKVVKAYTVNRKIRKYNADEIKKVLKAYETATGGLDDKKIEIVNRLFIATISGSKLARKYFGEFKTKFGTLDGAFKEEYSDLEGRLSLWDRK